MHIQDEHIQNNTKEYLRKRRYGVLAEHKMNSASTTLSPDPSTSIPTSPITSATECDSNTTADTSITGYIGTKSTQKALKELTSSLIEKVNNDEDDPLPVQSDEKIQVLLHKLFDFSTQEWVFCQLSTAVGTLDDEMTVYELYDLETVSDLVLDVEDTLKTLLVE
ncbi:hypothetical protein AX16_001567 [Volvariella volvacea WC 439]|nr:hypothetical protein AX16_001567 [Volvariella volvacea WC 439]